MLVTKDLREEHDGTILYIHFMSYSAGRAVINDLLLLTREGFVRMNFHRKSKHFLRVFTVDLNEMELNV